jgi:hypothetical protein
MPDIVERVPLLLVGRELLDEIEHIPQSVLGGDEVLTGLRRHRRDLMQPWSIQLTDQRPKSDSNPTTSPADRGRTRQPAGHHLPTKLERVSLVV